jgi:hypothetical protein
VELIMTESTELWAVHVEGPDDIVAAKSKEDAEREADNLNNLHLTEGLIPANAKAIVWPYSAEAHAKNIEENWIGSTE